MSREAVESYGLEEIQAALLSALIVYDEICRKNDICYSLHGGTLLGAERNHRFIPWDDDIDISMKRSEYKKLQAAISQFPENFRLDEHTTWVPRLVMEVGNEVINLDIFVWDYISTNPVAQKTKITLLRFFQGMMKTHAEYEKFGLVNRVLLFVTHTIGLVIPWQVKLRQFKYICEKVLLGDKKAIHRANDSFAGIGYIFDAAYMDEYTDIEFEGRMLKVNKRYHEFLERSYGKDYMIPPPKDQRVPTHENVRKDLRKL